MVNLLVRFLLNGVAVLLTAYLLPGVDVTNYETALITALVLSLANVIIKPILIVLTIPITVVTLGLFLLVINAINDESLVRFSSLVGKGRRDRA